MLTTGTTPPKIPYLLYTSKTNKYTTYTLIIKFQKNVSYKITLDKSKEIAIQDTVNYYQKYKPSYFNHNEKK